MPLQVHSGLDVTQNLPLKTYEGVVTDAAGAEAAALGTH